MRLAFFEEQLHDVEVRFRPSGQGDAIRWGRAWRGLANSQRRPIADGHDLRDQGLAIEHCNRLAAPYRPKVLAESSLQFRDAHLFHDSIMTRTSHIDKVGSAVGRCVQLRRFTISTQGAAS